MQNEFERDRRRPRLAIALLAGALAAGACSGNKSPIAPAGTSAGAAATLQTCAAGVTVLSAGRRGGAVHVTVRNAGDGCEIRVGLATYKRIHTAQALSPSNLALYADSNVTLRAGETRELTTDVPPCGPFRMVAYHTRSSAGQPAVKGAPSGYDLAAEHVLSSGDDVWNRWPECVA